MLQGISEIIFADEEHLVHLFEAIHFSLFFVLVIFLLLALWLLFSAAKTADMWDSYRAFIRSFEKTSFHARANKRVLDFGRQECEKELDNECKSTEERLAKVGTFYEKLCGKWLAGMPTYLAKQNLIYNSFNDNVWDMQAARERLRFQRLRHGFLIRPLDVKKPNVLLPQVVASLTVVTVVTVVTVETVVTVVMVVTMVTAGSGW